MTSQPTVSLNRGSNLAWTLVLTDAAGAAVDVTGWTVSVVAVIPPALASSTSCTVSDGPNGVFSLSIPWSSSWPSGEGSKVSIRLKPSGIPDAFPEIVVNLE
jgi:hypothetical protein